MVDFFRRLKELQKSTEKDVLQALRLTDVICGTECVSSTQMLMIRLQHLQRDDVIVRLLEMVKRV